MIPTKDMEDTAKLAGYRSYAHLLLENEIAAMIAARKEHYKICDCEGWCTDKCECICHIWMKRYDELCKKRRELLNAKANETVVLSDQEGLRDADVPSRWQGRSEPERP